MSSSSSSSSQKTNKPPPNFLAQITRTGTHIIADTADYKQLSSLPDVCEVTTNPSIIWQAAQKPDYFHLLEETYKMYAQLGKGGTYDMVEAVPAKFGREILRLLPVPSAAKFYLQLDPRYSFNVDQAIDKTRFLVDLCVKYHNMPKEKIVVKIAGSWEGIQAVEKLEKEGVSCLVTAITSIVQAVAAAEAGASYVAPYVGRVSDWKDPQKTPEEETLENSHLERGIALARDTQLYYKHTHTHKTKVMAASIRGPEQVKALAGIDILTLNPSLIVKMECMDPIYDDDEGEGETEGVTSFVPVDVCEEGKGKRLKDLLTPRSCALLTVAGVDVDEGGGGREEKTMSEAEFRAGLQADACGTAVFARSMKLFVEDLNSLEKVFIDYLGSIEKRA